MQPYFLQKQYDFYTCFSPWTSDWFICSHPNLCIGPIALALHGLELEALLDDVDLGEVAAPELLFSDQLGYEVVAHLLEPLIFCDECLDSTNDRGEVGTCSQWAEDWGRYFCPYWGSRSWPWALLRSRSLPRGRPHAQCHEIELKI